MGKITRNIDWLAFAYIVSISVFGLFILLTVDRTLFIQQLFFFVLGLICAISLSRLDSIILWWLGPIVYILSIVLLIAPFFFPEIRGANRWISVGQIQFQPSELIKPFIIISFARFISTYSPRNIKYLPLHVVLFVPLFFIVFKQPDFGTALIFGIMWLGMMLAGGLQFRLLFVSGIVTGILTPLLWKLLAQYQRNRFLSFFNPAFDPQGIGYNALQAVIAVGSGGIFGRGLGRGTQSHLRFLPEFHTDFIFATLVEEVGFMGGSVLLVLFVLLLWRLLEPLITSPGLDVFGYLYVIGIFCMVLGQMVVHIGMNMGIVPVTGITLPFVSYGGSSMIALMVSFGLLWSIQKSVPEALDVV